MSARMNAKTDPLESFKIWYEEAEKSEQKGAKTLPEACALGSATKEGRPSVRFVLLKGVDAEGFYFFTNYLSQKSKDFESNPFASLCFFWDYLQKQIRIEGRVNRVSERDSDTYFKTRARGSQIGAWASVQSSPIAGREELEKKVEEFTLKFEGRDVPRPPHWGGFRLVPDRMEFWTGRESRLHDREVFVRANDGRSWKFQKLSP